MKVGIVGGGIVGSAIAVWLLGEGHEPVLFEREPDGRPASVGNAGLLAFPEILPLARPGIVRQAPRWLLDPLGPLALRWRDAPALLPWLLAFARASSPERVRRSTEALAEIMGSALADHQELARRAGYRDLFHRTGSLTVFRDEAGLAGALAGAQTARRLIGCDAERLNAAEARRLVPELEGSFHGALHQLDHWTVTHPAEILAALHARLPEIVPETVIAVEPAGLGAEIVSDGGSRRPFDAVVIAAGIRSRDLARQLGLSLLLETERGYNTTFADPPFRLAMPVFFGDHGFVASPFRNALRVGGAVELADPDAPPNFARARAMLTIARRYMPAIPQQGGEAWMGRRPSTPDSLPVISPHPRHRGILFAFGHGHLGLTLSAATARRVSAFLAGRNDEGDPFSIRRFQKGA